MSTVSIPAHRINLAERAARQYAALARLEASIELEPTLRHLVKIRASQINGCAFCIDMHTKDARADGEREERLYLLDAWRESPLYDEREQAALALCEAVTLVADTHVPDEAWDRAAAVFDPDELGQLLFAITTINAWNRIAISTRVEPGHYEPGMFSAA
ncbi:MAG TPA: carboxymuconolactone decarboxylase family protein [Capillimicrobium sp.]|jgi:AhpD family alkylhydroperoxidase